MSHKAIQYNRFVTYGSVTIYGLFATILCKNDKYNKGKKIFYRYEEILEILCEKKK